MPLGKHNYCAGGTRATSLVCTILYSTTDYGERQSKFDCFGFRSRATVGRTCPIRIPSAKIAILAFPVSFRVLLLRTISTVRFVRHSKSPGFNDATTTMEDNQNGAAVVARPPGSDTCGIIVNLDDDRTAAQPPSAAATPIGVPAPSALPYGARLNNNNNNNNAVIKAHLKVWK